MFKKVIAILMMAFSITTLSVQRAELILTNEATERLKGEKKVFYTGLELSQDVTVEETALHDINERFCQFLLPLAKLIDLNEARVLNADDIRREINKSYKTTYSLNLFSRSISYETPNNFNKICVYLEFPDYCDMNEVQDEFLNTSMVESFNVIEPSSKKWLYGGALIAVVGAGIGILRYLNSKKETERKN